MASLSSTTSQSVTIRVLAASTGVCYRISLHPSQLTAADLNVSNILVFSVAFSVANIRGHLAAAVPASDQILLLGPPYKVPRDTTFQSEEILNSLRLGDQEDETLPPPATTDESKSQNRSFLSTAERSGARRLFLFSKQALSENAPDPPNCNLGPMDLKLPSEPPGSSPLDMTQSTIASQPLHQALSAYERQFMLYLCQGRVLADGADMRLQACNQCVQEQAVMARALRAAVSNLSDHFNGAARTRSEFTAVFQSKSSAHASLLQRFESILTGLGSIPLHPSLVAIARGSGRIMESLLDTVPVERERAWAQQCQTSHDRLVALFAELDTAFSQLGSPASREEETRQDLEAENDIQKLGNEVQDVVLKIRDSQAQRVERLTSDHGRVVKIIVDAINAESEQGKEDEVQKAFTPLRQISNMSKDVIPEMIEDDKTMKRLLIKVADAKTAAMKRMKVRLREISKAQSSIQRVLSSVGVLKSALTQQCDNMLHLEHVAELSLSYRDFLTELRRRRAYGQAVSSNATAMMERLAVMRSDEVKAREKFLKGSGRHLMPPFFEIFVPTLATPPPLFTPQMPSLVELDTLPNIGPADVTDAMLQGVTESGVGSASSLTAESQPVHGDKVFSSGGTEVMGSVQQQDQLIVSADTSGNDDVIMHSAPPETEDAELKTLAYENAVLRQALEKMGLKAPKTYIEEAKQERSVAHEELAALQKELEHAKAQTKAAQDALISAKTDKISHSSFEIGDIGLFMPTDKKKTIYLAFHTTCPHRYLSTDNIEGNPDFVLGRIVYQEELVAGEMGTDANPYKLHMGTKFWVLTVEVLKSSSS
eukprot:scaffold1062_cov130-Cylindrotheca_fusiformis.AAC.35